MTNLLLNDQLKPCWLLVCMTSDLFDGSTGLPGSSAWAVAGFGWTHGDAPRQNEAWKSKRRAKTGPSLTCYLGASDVTVRPPHPL